MSRTPTTPPPKLPLGRRVPGMWGSIAIAALALALSAWLAWRHPLVELRLTPRTLQPSGSARLERVIIDGTVERRVWGLFTVGHRELQNVSHFMMHTAPGKASLLAVTRGETQEVFTDTPGRVLRSATRLNAFLDHQKQDTVVIRSTSWLLFAWSWALLALGSLVMTRNGLVAPLRRRARRSSDQCR